MSDLSVAVAQPSGAAPDLAESVSRHLRQASLAAERAARLVLFPELSLSGYSLALTLEDAIEPQDPRLLPLQQLADAQGIVIVVGAPVASPAGLHVGSLSFLPGAPVTTYLKRHLGGSEPDTFTPGSGGESIALEDEVVGLAICAEIGHPEHAEAAASCGATIYAASCLVSEAGYETDEGRLRQRARDHGLLVMMANYSAPVPDWRPAGRSAIWASDGSLLASAPSSGEALVFATRTPDRWSGSLVASTGSF